MDNIQWLFVKTGSYGMILTFGLIISDSPLSLILEIQCFCFKSGLFNPLLPSVPLSEHQKTQRLSFSSATLGDCPGS